MRRSGKQTIFGFLGILLVVMLILGLLLPSVVPPPQDAPVQGSGLATSSDAQRQINELQQFLKNNPNDKSALLDLGAIYRGVGQYPLAIEQFNRVLQIDPQNAEAHFELGLCYASQNSLTAAITEYRKAIAVDGNDPLYHLNLGLALANNTPPDIPSAISAWQKVRTLDPTGQYGVKAEQLIRQYQSN